MMTINRKLFTDRGNRWSPAKMSYGNNSVRNRFRLFAVVIVALALIYAAAITVHYVRALHADNRELYAAVVEQKELLIAKGMTCERLLSDPVVKRIMSAK